MAKCIRCDGEMCSFTLTERGRCNHCGFDVEDMAEILYESLAALEDILEDYERIAEFIGLKPEDFKNIKRARVAIAKAKTGIDIQS